MRHDDLAIALDKSVARELLCEILVSFSQVRRTNVDDPFWRRFQKALGIEREQQRIHLVKLVNYVGLKTLYLVEYVRHLQHYWNTRVMYAIEGWVLVDDLLSLDHARLECDHPDIAQAFGDARHHVRSIISEQAEGAGKNVKNSHATSMRVGGQHRFRTKPSETTHQASARRKRVIRSGSCTRQFPSNGMAPERAVRSD